jgi:hypothetical protein
VLVAVVLSPTCDAVTEQLPVLLKVTVAEERPLVSIDELPAEQGPDVLKLTSCPFGELFDSAVAVTLTTVACCELPSTTELGNGPSTIVWLTVSTAGGDGALERDVEPTVSGTSVVAIV